MAAKEAASLSEALSSGFLTCSICLEHFRQPRILPCLHSFCHRCLDRLARKQPELRCPECRLLVPLPSGVGGLQSNFFINGLLELVRPAGKGVPACSLCPLLGHPAASAASRCLDCADNLCGSCAGGHRCSRATHAHRLVPIEAFLAGEHAEAARELQASHCRVHAGEELRFFCTPCSAALCRECRLGTHLEHPCLSLPEVAQARRPLVEELLAGAEEKARRMARAQAGLEEGARQLRESQASLRVEVEQVCAEAVQELLDRQEALLGRLAAHVEERLAAAEVLRVVLEAQAQAAAGTVAFARRVLSLGRPAEIVSLERLISERLRQLQGFSWEPFAFQLPQLHIHPHLRHPGSLLRLQFREEEPEEPSSLQATAAEAEEATGEKAPGQEAPPPEEGPRWPAKAPAPSAPCPVPMAVFSCSFWAKVPGDKVRPKVTGLCALGPAELLLADEKNRKLKRFSLQGDFKGTIPVPSEATPFSVASVGGKVAFTAGSRLYLLNRQGGVAWQKALQPGQASHSLAPLDGERLAVSVAERLEVYSLEGKLLEKVVPRGGGHERCLVYLAGWKGGFVGADWYRHSVVLLSGGGKLIAELREEQLEDCQPGAVCVDTAGIVYVVLQERNRVLAFAQDGEPLGAFLTSENSIDRPRVTTVAADGRFAVALSNGTVHIFKIRYQSR